MTDQEKAQLLIDRASRVMTATERDLCERITRGDTHLLGEWTTKEDRRMWTWCETNFAQYFK